MSAQIISEGEVQLLNALMGASAILDNEGNIIVSNNNWKTAGKCMDWLRLNTKEKNFFEQCKKAVDEGYFNAISLIFNLRDVIEGIRQQSELTISIKNNGVHWCKVTISRFSELPLKVLLSFEDITPLMNSYYKYRDKEERYSHHFKHSVSGIIFGTPDGGIIDANPAACRILGYSREELIAGGESLFVDPNDPKHLEMIRVRNEKSHFEGEKGYIHKDGHQIYVDNTSMLYRENNNEHYILNTFQDKTSEKLANQSLDKERRFTHTALNSIPGLFLVLDSGLNIVRWNQSFLFDTGIHEEELTAFPITNLFAKEDQLWTNKVLQQIFKTGKGNFVSKVTTRHNGTRYYNFHVNSFESIEESFLVITAIDITDLRISENEREKNSNLLNQLFDNSPLPMVMIDHENIIQKVNDGFQALFHYDEDELMGKQLDGLITSDTEIEEGLIFSKTTFDEIVKQKQTIRITKHGDKIPVILITVPVFHNNEIIAAFGIYVDLRKQQELAIRP
ncbi:MAG: PAS domain S-box protein [Balneolaceae bacterium]|nr:MAG: PAS domain S-box protein [Balneolaceae bacterium]